MSSSAPVRAPLLDICRAIAVLLVVGHHPPSPTPDSFPGRALLAPWDRMGWTGVDLFFVLSGFLIGRLLMRELKQSEGLNVRRFWLKRIWKLWPPYFVFIAASIAWFWITSDRSPADTRWFLWTGFWPNFFHVQNYFGTNVGHTWSLAIEEHFYLALPLLLVVVGGPKKGRQWLMPVAAVIISVAVLMARFGRANGEFSLMHNYVPTHLRFDALFIGVLLAWAIETYGEKLRKLQRAGPVFALGFILCFAPFAIVDRNPHPWTYTWGLTLLAVGSACLVMWAWLGEPLAAQGLPLPLRALAAVGRWSYSIYLWQRPFADALALRFVDDVLGMGESTYRQPALMAAMTGFAVTLGCLGYYLVEKPALRLRDRFVRDPAPQPAAPSATRAGTA